MPKALPKEITSYDLIKTFAVIIMIIDHAGYYFYPDDTWWRVVGRFGLPVWFFLIGYAQGRNIGPKLWVGGGILVLANMATGMFIFPLNALFTMAFARLLIDKIMGHCLKGQHEFWAVNVILFFLIIPTSIFTEYGTQGMIMAIFGYLIRHKEELEQNHKQPKLLEQYFIYCTVSTVFVQAFLFGFVQEELMVLGLEIFVIISLLYFFRPITYPKVTQVLPNFFVAVIKLCGRRTLEIYVGHLLLFKVIAAINGRNDWFDWTVMIAL